MVYAKRRVHSDMIGDSCNGCGPLTLPTSRDHFNREPSLDAPCAARAQPETAFDQACFAAS